MAFTAFNVRGLNLWRSDKRGQRMATWADGVSAGADERTRETERERRKDRESEKERDRVNAPHGMAHNQGRAGV
jgi:hypothetical protein